MTADDERGLVGTVLAVHTRRGRPTLSVVVPGLGEVTASASGVVGAVLPAPGAAVTLGVTPDAVVVLPGE